ncbi:hypothetical protein [Oceanobacillus salinisoli]|uniref:hypothetical protein n=1 Tax=Oceanobacillus salinisoli TaxID=2678611 RepID=UPI0012E2A40B|nr:hypothetical protein [Oceanobacillus salinisoli]
MKKMAVILGVLSVCFIVVILSITNETALPVSAKNHQLISSSLEKDEMLRINHNRQLNHEEIVVLTDEFMDILVQDTGEDYKVADFHTVESLLTEFKRVATKEAASPYVEYYYEEEPDGLYILPTETPPWFIADNDYEIEYISDNHVKIIQENTTDMYGEYVIEIEFTYDSTWKISNITHR